MEQVYDPRTRSWTTNNGFAVFERQIQSPGSLSIQQHRNVSANGIVENEGQIAAITKISTSYSPDLIGVQSKFRRKYYHKVLVSILIVLIVLLVIAIVIISLGSKTPEEICNSPECIRAAATYLYSMDKQIDPCEDFYRFTCGKWSETHPKPDSVTSNDWFREHQAYIMRKLRQFLRSNVSQAEPEAVTKAKNMYQACMNIDLLDKRDMEPVLHFIRLFELPVVPRGLNLTGLTPAAVTKYNNSASDFHWLRSLVLIKEYLSIDLFIGFDIFPDPLNRTINRLAFGTPEVDTALPFNKDDMHKLWHKIRRKIIFDKMDYHSDETDADDDNNDDTDDLDSEEMSTGQSAYVKYITQIVQLYMSYVDVDLKKEDLSHSAAEMAMKSLKIAKEVYRLKDEAENMTKTSTNPIEDLVYITLADLQKQTDKLIKPKSVHIWHDYLQLLFENRNVSFDINAIEVMTSNADIFYLQNIVKYLTELPAEDLEFYIWLYVVEELILHTTSGMRNLHTDYLQQVVGTESATPRSLYCAHTVNSLMGMALSYSLVHDKLTSQKLSNVQNMLVNIRAAFETLVKETAWMDESTKKFTLQKSAEMQSFIGFPEWISDKAELDAHYEGVQVNASLHLENLIGVLHWQMVLRLNNLNVTEPAGWATAPTIVNAFHTFQSNAITIPIAILHYPFYDLGLEVLNYGSIGTILGHELTHGFDDSGRMFDKNGNMLQWWTNDTISEYINRTECFIEQYSSYYLPDIDEYIDGEQTLGENIADNGGMREAFYAYRIYAQNMGGDELLLPGLEQYSAEQLFFIAFGNLWCETYTPAASRYALEDTHCPGKFRLRGVLTNSEEFAEVFKCPKGSAMNPNREKCRIW